MLLKVHAIFFFFCCIFPTALKSSNGFLRAVLRSLRTTYSRKPLSHNLEKPPAKIEDTTISTGILTIHLLYPHASPHAPANPIILHSSHTTTLPFHKPCHPQIATSPKPQHPPPSYPLLNPRPWLKPHPQAHSFNCL